MGKLNKILSQCTGFQWDAGNTVKNWHKHQVSMWECEQIFFRRPLIVKRDKKHSEIESRYYALGRTDLNRHLFVVFTIRTGKIRIISARDMTHSEILRYKK